MSHVTVITGGANGIGRCMAELFAGRQHRVWLMDRDEATLARLAPFWQNRGWFIQSVAGDVGSRADLERFANQLIDLGQPIDNVIHNACFSRRGLLSGCSWDDFMSVLSVGVAAPYYLTRLLLPHLRQGASIVNISSTRAFQSQADTESYSAAKGGITALTHAMAASLAGRARVNAIAPGWIDTGAWYDPDYQPRYTPGDESQHLSGRVGRPEDIAELAWFLCQEQNTFIDGQTIVVDGGMSCRMIYHGDEGWQVRTDENGRRL